MGEVQSKCRDIGPKGFMVRSLCSRTCGCDKHKPMLLIKHGCSRVCLANLFHELYYEDETAASSISECKDHDEVLKDPTHSRQVSEYFHKFENYFKLPQGRFNSSLFQSLGCQALQVLQNNKKDSIQYVIRDALCGVTHTTNAALRRIQYTTLRWVCPMSCGCTVDISDECPRSCTDRLS